MDQNTGKERGMVCRVLADLTITYVNPAFCEVLGASAEYAHGRSLIDWLRPELRKTYREAVAAVATTGEERRIYLEGRPGGWHLSRRPLSGEVICVGKNVQEHLIPSAVDMSRYDRERLQQMFDALPVVVGVKTNESRYVFVNQAFEEAFGVTKRDIIGQTDALLVESPERVAEIQNQDRSVIEQGREVHFPVTEFRFQDGTVHWVEVTKVPLFDMDGACRHVLVTHDDRTAQREYEEHLGRLAYFDEVTGLWNRNGLERLVDEAAGAEYVLIGVDIRHFQRINATYGSEYGDRLLKAMARALREENGQMEFARFSADEFIGFLPFCDEALVKDWFVRLRRRLDAVLRDETLAYHVELYSVYVCAEPGKRFREAYQELSLVFRYAREHEEETVHVYRPDMKRNFERLARIIDIAEKALRTGEFHLVYQPQLDLITKRVVGVEALGRWVSPELGFVSPGEFIPAFTRTELIIDYTFWTVRQLCSDYPRLLAKYGADIHVSLNVSPRVILNPRFQEYVVSEVRRHNVPPDRVTLEITEDLFLTGEGEAADQLQQLRDHGFRIALDDFGSGYSSLSQIGAMPLDELKIDRSLVTKLTDRVENLLMLQAIVQIGRTFKLSTVVEGVEFLEQLKWLEPLEPLAIQGYVYGKPKRLE